MSDETARLHLPYLAAGQAQKHVTLNEGLGKLDALVQLSVAARLATPPASPEEGGRWIVATSPTGAWTGRAGQVAERSQGEWLFHVPQPGWRAFVVQERAVLLFVDAGWTPLGALGGPLSNVAAIGIGTAADAANPLSARLNTALLAAVRVGGGGDGDVRVTLDREAASDTASLLMSTRYAAQAEFGLAGDDKVRLKVKQGAAWSTALCVTPAGRLAVGDADPSAALDVRGAVKVGDNGMNDGMAFGDAGASLGSSGVYLVRRDAAGSSAGAVLHVGGYDGVQLHVQDTPGSLSTARLSVKATSVSVGAALLPAADNATPLGASDRRYSAIYSATSVVVSSDAREKQDVSDCDLGLAFVRRLRPCSYLRDGDGARHYGLLAQEVQAALGDRASSFSGLVEGPDGRLGLRYEQFVPILLKAVAELAERLERGPARRSTRPG